MDESLKSYGCYKQLVVDIRKTDVAQFLIFLKLYQITRFKIFLPFRS